MQDADTHQSTPGEATHQTRLDQAERDQTQSLEAAQALGRLDRDQAEHIFEQLTTEQVQRIATALPESAQISDDEADALAASADINDAVVGLATPVLAALESWRTVAEAISLLVHSDSVQDITYIYIVDDDRLTGVVGMRDIVLARPGQTLAEIMVGQPFALASDMPISAAVREALARHYTVYPVVDADQRLVGTVRSWRLFERVAFEVTGQVGAQVGVSREETVATELWPAFLLRHPWLQVNLMTAFIAAFVVGMFEGTITRMVALAAFLPVLAGQSGNTGCQAMAITLRGLTLGQLEDYPVRKLLRKEMLLGTLNGAVVGLVAGIAMWIYASMSGEAHPLALGLVILVAMTGACIGSGVFGVFIPLTLKRLGADPAMASSIFLTTITDILGMGLMLLLASALLL